MTRQWCVPSHEGSVLFGMSSVRCRRTDVKREPLVGQPSTAPQIDFFADLLAPCKSCCQKCPAKQIFRKPRLGRRKQNIAAGRTAVRRGRQPNLAAITRSFAAPISMPSAPIAVLLSAPPRWQRWQHWQSATASSRKMTTWPRSQRPID